MHKHHTGNKHDEFQNFKAHLHTDDKKECGKMSGLTRDPIKLLGTAAIAGLLLGMLMR